MADFEEELRLDAEENAREAEYILNALPADLKDKYSTDDILYMMDVIVEYYFESGILEGGDDNDYVDIDLQAVAEFVCSKAKEDGRGEYSADEVLFVAQATWIFRKRILTEVCISTQV